MARPTKLTTETQESILDAILHGATKKDAAESAGIDYDTFNNWMKAGQEATKGAYFEFFVAVRKAQAECRKNMTRIWITAIAKGDWKAAEAYLKRRDKENWGDAVDVTSGGEALKIIVEYANDKPDAS